MLPLFSTFGGRAGVDLAAKPVSIICLVFDSQPAPATTAWHAREQVRLTAPARQRRICFVPLDAVPRSFDPEHQFDD
jgi:hypothetical protein